MRRAKVWALLIGSCACAAACAGEITFSGSIVVDPSQSSASTTVEALLSGPQGDALLTYFTGYAGASARLVTTTYQ
jgi:hypothetical protein